MSDIMTDDTMETPNVTRTDTQVTFEKELETLINRHCKENGSNTPDFILAQYMSNCLQAFNTATLQRETWHGRNPRPAHTRYGVELTN